MELSKTAVKSLFKDYQTKDKQTDYTLLFSCWVFKISVFVWNLQLEKLKPEIAESNLQYINIISARN